MRNVLTYTVRYKMNIVVSFLVSFQAVEFMRQGKSPSEAASLALAKIAKYYPQYSGGLVVVNKDGEFGGLRLICCSCLNQHVRSVLSLSFLLF